MKAVFHTCYSATGLRGTVPGEWKLELVRVICPFYHPRFGLLPVVWSVVGHERDWPQREDFDNTGFPVFGEWPWVTVGAGPCHCCFTARGSGQASKPVPTPRAPCFQQPGVLAAWFCFVAWVSSVHPFLVPSLLWLGGKADGTHHGTMSGLLWCAGPCLIHI